MAKALSGNTVCLATDVSSHAGQATQICATLSSVQDSVQLLVTDMCAAVRDRLAGSVDLILFNPPYVPTPETEIAKTGADGASLCHA